MVKFSLGKFEAQELNNSQCENNSFGSKEVGGKTLKASSKKLTARVSTNPTGHARQEDGEGEDEDPFGLADSIGKSLEFKKDPANNQTMIELPKKKNVSSNKSQKVILFLSNEK